MSETKAFNVDLRRLVEREGPFLSLYLNTEAATEDAPHEIELRWRARRDAAAAAGAGDDLLAAVDEVVKGSHRKGDGLVVFGAGDDVAVRRFLPTAIPDGGAFGPLPTLVPYLEWQQDNPRYAVVVADREGAEIHVVGGFDPDQTIEVEGDHDVITKVSPGGWSQRRFQQRAEDSWEANAKEVAGELERIVRDEDLAFVVIAGDVRAAGFLREHVAQEIESIAVEVAAEPFSLDEIRDELVGNVGAYVGQTIKQTLDKFEEERGQNDLAAEGADATFEALRRAQVDALLVARDVSSRSAWFAVSDLTQAATDKGPLTDLGIGDVAEAEATDVAVRAALGTGARIVVLPSEPAGSTPKDGIGALLRYA